MVLNKLFGKKKEEKYFLEIDTKTENQPSADTTVNAGETTVELSTPEVTETTVTATTIEPKINASYNVSYDAPEWVKAIKNYSNQGNNASTSNSEKENFAGKYITNNVPQSRRRPGPSLAGFKNMASKIGK
ncbi:hypothetical protein [Geminocystis sp. GBBB08]|uniref:hypothetical protein n=1 Tax=Geminocystis sp. GBBB08 TaxID=2604140 RepID=UPI0027E39E97|nr:hypothetical protein [Geminocystis sp. GBBB08]MBL1210890.1 hypothetical protein [Geminocystis sp. GBBB08]